MGLISPIRSVPLEHSTCESNHGNARFLLRSDTYSAMLFHSTYSYATDTWVDVGPISVVYPTFSGIPMAGVSIDDLIEHSSTTEDPAGVYWNLQTIHDVYDFDFDTLTEEWLWVDNYYFAVYDPTVVRADVN